MGQLIGYQGILPEVGAGVFIGDGARVIGNVTLRKGANVWYNTVLRGDIAPIRAVYELAGQCDRTRHES